MVGDTGVGDKNSLWVTATVTFRDPRSALRSRWNCPPFGRWSSAFLPRDDHFVQTDGNESGTQVQTSAPCSLWHKGRVEPPSRKRRTKRLGWHTEWLVSGVRCEVANEGLRRTGGIRGIHFPFERGGLKKRAGKKLHHSDISAKGLGKTSRLGKGQKNLIWDPRL